MDGRRSNGIAVIAAIIIMALMGLTLLVSCTTKEIVTKETSWVHDTVEVHRADTLWEYKFITQRDTVRQESVHTVVLNDRGDTIREIHHYHDTEKIVIVDSTYKYKAERDSLRKALETKEKENRKERKMLSWWDVFECMAKVVLFALALGWVVKWCGRRGKWI